MKQINLVYNRTEKESRLDRQWSRITSTKPVLTMLTLLMVALFGVNESAWGISQTKLNVNVSGNGTIKVNTSASQPSDAWSSSTVSKEQYDGWSVGKTDTYYIWVNPNSGYRCTGVSDCSWNSNGYYTISFKGATLQKNATKTVTATFVGNSYAISFAGNGNTSGSMSDQSGFVYGTAKTLSTNTFGRAYTVIYDANGGSCGTSSATATYTFNGWKSSNGTSYADKASVSTFSPTPAHGAAVTLTAQWTSASVTLPNATKDGAVLDGWYSGNTKIGDPGDAYTPTANITLTAKWISKYDFEITGGNYTINNEAWNKTGAFTFVHADEAHMTTTIQNPDVISYNRGTNTITALKIGTSKITFTQNTSTTVNNGEIEFTITVDSVANNLAVSGTSFTRFVEQDIANIRSGENSNGTISTTSSNYNLAHYNIATNTIEIPNSDSQLLPFDDVTITISQAPTAKYKAKKHTITLTVQKYENTLTCSWGSWSKNVNFDSETGVTFSSDNDAVAPIVIEQQTGTTNATYDEDNNEIDAFHNIGSATWHVSQAEDYKYKGATTQTLSVTVAKANTTCYILENQSDEQHNSLGGTTHEHTWSEENVAGVVKFDAAHGTSSVSYYVEVQQYLNGSWQTVPNSKSDDFTTEYTCDKQVTLTPAAKGVRFFCSGTMTGIWVRNVSVTRKKWLDIKNAAGTSNISSLTMNSRTRTGAAVKDSFLVSYSTCESTIKLRSSNPHVKFANGSTYYSFTPDNTHSKKIVLTYTSDVAENIAATITVYTLSDRKTLTVNAQTLSKLTTTLEYKGADSYPVNHANMNATDLFQVRDQNGALVASPAITLSSSNTDAINTVSSNTAIDFLCGANNVRITASYAGDETYAAASNSGTFYHDIDVIKLSDAIVWSNVAEDGKIHVWAESDIPNTIASANEAIDAYTSSNSANVRVSGSKGTFALRARRPGEITLTAHSEGSCTYSTAEDTKTIMVDSCAQDIIWEQNLAGLSTEEDGTISRRITLNAYAVDSNNVETGRVITYSLPANTSFASIENGNELVLTGTGSVVLTASTASDDTIYAQAQASKLVRVRVYGTGCGSEIVDKDQHAVGAYDNNKGKQYGDVNPLPPIDKIYVRVGKYSDVATQTLYIYGYNASGTETTLASYGVGNLTTSGDDKELSNISEDICRIKIKAGGTISKWYSDLRITQKSYLRKSVENISNDHLFVFENVNETIRVSYSDKPLLQYRYTGSNLTLTPTETVNNDCGDYGYYDFVLSGSYSRMGDYHDTIYITTTALDTLRVPVYHRVSTGGSLLFNEADGNWSESGKWSNDMLPRRENDVIISKNVIVTGEVEAYSVTLVSGGSITIMPGSGLTVGAGGITGSTTSNLILKAGTTGDTKGQTGYLRIAPEYTGDMPNASVELYSIGYYDRSNSNKNIAAWQFVGSPIEGGVAKEIYPTTSWIYSWIESTGNWTNQKRTLVMQSFRGYETTQMKSADGQLLIYPGQLALNRDTVIDLDWTDILHGENLLANSFAAPIDITKLVNTDFVNAERTLYLFNTGSLSQYNTHNGATGDDAGQFRTISIGTASDMASLFAGDASIPTIIPSMQGFVVKASATGAKLKLDYNRLVWSADYSEHPNKPLRAPKRNTETNEEEEKPITGSMKMTLEANGSADNVYMLESERYITDFEDGYDAHKMEAGNFNIYTIEDEHKLAIDATSSIIGTRVGVRTGEETAYTMSFSYVDGEQEWSLLDMETSQMIDIANGNTYTFFAEPNAEINGRFMIVERADVPSVATGCDNVSEGAKAHKFVKDDQMYILKNGVLYNVMGTVVK